MELPVLHSRLVSSSQAAEYKYLTFKYKYKYYKSDSLCGLH